MPGQSPSLGQRGLSGYGRSRPESGHRLSGTRTADAQARDLTWTGAGTALAKPRLMCARASEGGPNWWELRAATRAVAVAIGLGAVAPPSSTAEPCPPPRLRSIQDAAARTLALDERPRWRARSRWSALLPIVTARVDRNLGWKEGGAAQTVPIEVDHDQGAEVRMTWRLERLVYDRDEPSLLAAERSARRARVALDQEVTQLYFRWRRVVADAADPDRGGGDRDDRLNEAEAFAQLDAVTGGWLGRQGGSCP